MKVSPRFYSSVSLGRFFIDSLRISLSIMLPDDISPTKDIGDIQGIAFPYSPLLCSGQAPDVNFSLQAI
jgi:hypothetical protein